MRKTPLTLAITFSCLLVGSLQAAVPQDSLTASPKVTLDDGKFKPPKPLADINRLIEYPQEAATTGKEGDVKIALLIDEHGTVVQRLIKSASDSVFIAPTLAAVKRMAFAPATHEGTPLKAWLTMSVHFKGQKKKKG
jgi:TonB family protein